MIATWPESCGRLLNAARARPTRGLIALGASGSVGGCAMEYLALRPEIRLYALSVHSSASRLAELIERFAPLRAALTSDAAFDREAGELRARFPNVEFYRGEAGAIEMITAAANDGADTALTAVVGAAGIRMTLRAIELGLKIALANKETLVTAGPAIEARLADLLADRPERAPAILPVDSEHNGVFQLISALRPDHLKRIILTASGGPFRDAAPADIQRATRAQVLNHPNWSMGPKITVDSAGMINKGLEIIEARYLFSVPYERLGVFIHRPSLAHALVETTDGGYLICASRPNMVFPTAHALHYPEPVPAAHAVATPASAWQPLAFEEIAEERYPGFALCLAAGERGGTAPALLNAANEEAVRFFLEDRISFADIPRLIAEVLERIPAEDGADLELFLEADAAARRLTAELAARRSSGARGA